MRTVVQHKTNIRAGDLARIYIRLKNERTRARVFIYSRYNGRGDFAPHTDETLNDMLKNGKPLMLQPSRVILSADLKPKVSFTFRASEPMEFQVIEELDFGDTPNCKARIKVDGKIVQACGRILRSIKRKLRRGAPEANGR